MLKRRLRESQTNLAVVDAFEGRYLAVDILTSFFPFAVLVGLRLRDFVNGSEDGLSSSAASAAWTFCTFSETGSTADSGLIFVGVSGPASLGPGKEGKTALLAGTTAGYMGI